MNLQKKSIQYLNAVVKFLKQKELILTFTFLDVHVHFVCIYFSQLHEFFGVFLMIYMSSQNNYYVWQGFLNFILGHLPMTTRLC